MKHFSKVKVFSNVSRVSLLSTNPISEVTIVVKVKFPVIVWSNYMLKNENERDLKHFTSEAVFWPNLED